MLAALHAGPNHHIDSVPYHHKMVVVFGLLLIVAMFCEGC